jgi:CubicO group peptidase (beta-lactamase class C family)
MAGVAAPTAATRRWRRATCLALALAASGCADWAPVRAVQVASGFNSHLVCIDHFVGGMPAAQSHAQRVASQRGMGLVDWAMRTEVDTQRQQVATTVAGGFSSRAQFRPGWGCQLIEPGGPMDDRPAAPAALAAAAAAAAHAQAPAGDHGLPQSAAAALAGAAEHAPADPALAQALAAAFDEVPGGPQHRTLAVLVLRDGALLGERYAPGVSAASPILGFSASKSLLHALLGRAVQQGRLRVDQPAPIAAWAAAGDARGAITTDQLLRQTSGLDMGWDASGFGPSTRMLFIERDKAGFAAARGLAHAPGSHWFYTDANYLLASRVLRDAVGGSAADVLAFAKHELFDPLGLTGATLGFDATGTPMGAAMFSATARDWARLGQLYLDDGMVDGQRLLPAGWVAAARRPTLDTAYGAGWWTNVRGGDLLPEWGVPWGFAQAPRDAFFARGFMGQFVIVLPTQRLVVVRLGMSQQRGDDIEWVGQWLGGVLAALGMPAGATPAVAAVR